MTIRVSSLLVCWLAGAALAEKSGFQKAWEAGQDAFNLARYDDARAHFDRARALAPRLPGPYRWLGRIARVQQRWEECVQQSTTAVRIKPASMVSLEVKADIDACRSALGRPSYDRPLAPGQGALAVIVDVEGAAITVDGIAKGSTPLGAMPLNKGRHVVEARREGYRPGRAEIDVVPGIVVDAVMRLERAPN